MYWILFQCDAGLKSQAYKECMRPWSNAVLHMSRTQFNTHVKFGVDWFHLERLRCSLRLPSRSSLESNQTHSWTHIEIKPPGAPFWHYFKNRWPTRSLLFCVRFRLNKVRRLTQICVLLIIWVVDPNCHKIRLKWYTAFNPGLRSTFGTQKFGSFWKPIWEPKCHQLLKFTKVYKCLWSFRI